MHVQGFIRGFGVALAAMLVCAAASDAAAHDVPTDVKINMFVRPEGNRLALLIRLPLAAMRDIDFPTHGQNYLDVSGADDALRYATQVWLIDNIEAFEDDARLPPLRLVAARVSLPSDRSFLSFDRARRHLDEPKLADSLDLVWDQQLLDVLLETPIRSDRSQFALQPHLDRLGLKVSTALRFLPPGGATRAFELLGDPGLIDLDPSWRRAAQSFVVLGFWHILQGIDHLLFLLCLVIPFRRLRPLVVIVTAFTVAHSLSLFASAFGFVPDALWFPPLVETLIAVTIVYMALENIVGSNLRRRWIIAFAFGLVHGFGFSFGLRESLQFAGDHLVTSLLAFNIGVELGQLTVLVILVPLLDLLFRHAVDERLGIIILSALVAHTGWHWMTERGEQLAKFPWPRIDAAFLAGAMRGLMAVLVLAAILWAANGLFRRWAPGDSGS
jgi:HupE / UreJ protein